MNNDTLSVRGLSKAWAAQQALDHISFEQTAGSILGFSGDNGAGKSTLLKILASVLGRDRGQVSFGGISLDDHGPWRRMTGYVPQDLALDERLPVRDTLKFWAAARGLSKTDQAYILQAAAADPLISDFLDKTIRQCSGGMARRVSLIVGLLGDPRLLLLDEPFAGADQDSREMMIGRLLQLRSRGCTILVASHEPEVLDRLCDRILVLKDGKLTEAAVGSN